MSELPASGQGLLTRSSPDVPAEPRAVVRGLTKRYGGTPALDGVDLDLAAGEVVGFLGPNGAGKTTLLRVLTGALRATSGQARVLGLDPFRQAAALHQRLGYLPGDLRLPAHLTGSEVLDLCAVGRTDPGRDRDRLVDVLAAPLDTRVGALSKGNRQKLGIVQALMSRPDVLLLDEPTSGLDPLAQDVLEDLVREAAARGAAVLLSSHVLSEVEQVADRVVMLRQGRVVRTSRLDALRAAAPYDVTVELVDAAGLRRVADVPGVRDWAADGARATCTVPRESLAVLVQVLAGEHLRDVSVVAADLETLFRHDYERG